MKLPTKKLYTRPEHYPKFKAPEFADALKFPDDITKLDSISVSKLLGQYTLMHAWASQMKTDVEQELLVARAKVKVRETQLLSASPALRNSTHRWRIEFVLSTDIQIQELNAQVLTLETRRVASLNLCDTFERFTVALSRELSRKMASKDGLVFERAASR